MENKQALEFLTTPEEKKEVDIVLTAMSSNGRPLRLMRTFNQDDFQGGYIKFWRVMSPWHPNYGSDIGIMWLKEKGFIKNGN